MGIAVKYYSTSTQIKSLIELKPYSYIFFEDITRYYLT
jgi:hypothetical protein